MSSRQYARLCRVRRATRHPISSKVALCLVDRARTPSEYGSHPAAAQAPSAGRRARLARDNSRRSRDWESFSASRICRTSAFTASGSCAMSDMRTRPGPSGTQWRCSHPCTVRSDRSNAIANCACVIPRRLRRDRISGPATTRAGPRMASSIPSLRFCRWISSSVVAWNFARSTRPRRLRICALVT